MKLSFIFLPKNGARMENDYLNIRDYANLILIKEPHWYRIRHDLDGKVFEDYDGSYILNKYTDFVIKSDREINKETLKNGILYDNEDVKMIYNMKNKTLDLSVKEWLILAYCWDSYIGFITDNPDEFELLYGSMEQSLRGSIRKWIGLGKRIVIQDFKLYEEFAKFEA